MAKDLNVDRNSSVPFGCCTNFLAEIKTFANEKLSTKTNGTCQCKIPSVCLFNQPIEMPNLNRDNFCVNNIIPYIILARNLNMFSYTYTTKFYSRIAILQNRCSWCTCKTTERCHCKQKNTERHKKVRNKVYINIYTNQSEKSTRESIYIITNFLSQQLLRLNARRNGIHCNVKDIVTQFLHGKHRKNHAQPTFSNVDRMRMQKKTTGY